jgi:hypothetical protein
MEGTNESPSVLPQRSDLKKIRNRAEILPRRKAMTGLCICVGGWVALNAVLFAALMLRRDQPALRDRVFRWAVGGRREAEERRAA